MGKRRRGSKSKPATGADQPQDISVKSAKKDFDVQTTDELIEEARVYLEDWLSRETSGWKFKVVSKYSSFIIHNIFQ